MERSAQAAETRFAASSGQEALGHAIRAAELYMRAAADTANKTDASRLRRRCKDLIAHAERIKAQLANPPLATSPDELTILRRTSRLHGFDFPPWEVEPSEAEFELQPGDKPFIDDAVFSLSVTQRENFAAWSRPREIFQADHGGHDDSLFMDATSGSDLVQDVTTDCSVVASLSAALNILVGRRSVLSSIFYPFDRAGGRPRLSASGKYVLRLHFNGCPRRVVIDDRLPASGTDRTLFVVDRRNPRLMWPALLEKAYLKVRGGYDFPGSNSGTDLWVLTGWIPEQLFLQREDLHIDKVWQRISAAYAAQDVVITLGTGRISVDEEEVMGLIGEHDYAVQQLDASGGTRKLLIRNPWCTGPVWNGAGWPSLPQPRGDDPVAGQKAEQGDGSDGSLWVTLEDMAQNFESMYLNWNPQLFAHRKDRHFIWDLPPAYFSSSVVRNPQFCVDAPSGGLVWILVSRHFMDAELEIARKRTGSMASVSRLLGFMSILIYDDNGNRVQVADGATYRGPYVDSPQTLARLDARRGGRYTVVVDQHEFPLPSYTLTLSVFSQRMLQVNDAKEPLPYSKEHLGTWNRRTAGGNASCTTYFLNPQYRISVPQAGPLSILLSTDDRDVHVHVDLVWAGGKRATVVRVKDLVASSGEYRRGCAVLDIAAVDAGVYTVVCSTFEAGQLASFALRVTSMVSLELDPVPPPAAGRLRTPLKRLYLAGGEERMRAPLTASRLTQASVSACTAQTQTRDGSLRQPMVMLRLSVVHGWGSEQVTLAVSGDGELQEPTSALRTPEFDMEPERIRREGMWLVMESIGTHTAACVVEGDVFSESPVQIGDWEPA